MRLSTAPAKCQKSVSRAPLESGDVDQFLTGKRGKNEQNRLRRKLRINRHAVSGQDRLTGLPSRLQTGNVLLDAPVE